MPRIGPSSGEDSIGRFRYLGEAGLWFDEPQVEHRDHQDSVLLT